jgi:hypothetical protein
MMVVALVHIATLQAQFFTQIGSDIDGEAAGDWSGSGVSLSQDGSRVAVGAPQNDGAGANAGQARVYEWSGGAWTQVGADINGEAAGDRFGYAVALSADGTRLAVAATNNDGNGIDAGHVRVFEENGGVWTQLGADIDGEGAGDLAGYSVAITADGSRVAVGAIFNDGAGNDAGHARVFGLNGGAWVQLGADIDGQDESDWCGASVSFSAEGTRLAVGSQTSYANGPVSGHVRVFTYGPGTWTQVGQDIAGEAMNDNSGTSVSLSADGTRLAIGAPGNGGAGLYAGHTRVYSENGGVWTQLGADIDAEAMQNSAGVSVSLSGNGTLLAIGAFANNGNGTLSGQTRVYREVGSVWAQVGPDIDGEAAGDKAGQSVSFSGDGGRFAVGATYNDGSGSDAGHARVYELTAFIGVPEIGEEEALPVMPVPATDVLYIEVPERAVLRLFDTAGQLLLSQPLAAGRVPIDITTLPPGAYIAELRPYQGGTSRFAKVLVE